MAISNEHIQELKEAMEKDGKEVSWEEASKAVELMEMLANIAFDNWLETRHREKKLKEFPKGYTLDEDKRHVCAVCRNATPKGENWYDKYGIKCLLCQRAIDTGVIPAFVAKFEDSWYTSYDLERSFKLKSPILKRWIKEGIIKNRVILNGEGKTHLQLFLLKANKDFLPRKKMVESRMVREEKDGQTWHLSYPWYRFVDPFEHLREYRIMDYMRATTEEHEEGK
jgi:hypothetical protein